MKKILLLSTVLTLSISSSSHAFSLDDYMSKNLSSYLLPCAASIGAAMLMNSSEALATGASVCAGISTYRYVTSDQRVDDDSINNKIHDLADEVKDQIKENDIVAKENYSVYRDTIREVIAKEFDQYNDRFLENAKLYKKLRYLKTKPQKVNTDLLVDKVIEKIRSEE